MTQFGPQPGQSEIRLDPMFVNPPLQDYHLQPCSPCIGAGRHGADLGAYPYVSNAMDNNEISRPSDYILIGNYPNPFNSSTKINFELKQTDHTVIEIFNLGGQLVASPANERFTSGYHSVIFNPVGDLASGVYLVRLSTQTGSSIRKITYLK